jgi:hypothetical protein
LAKEQRNHNQYYEAQSIAEIRELISLEDESRDEHDNINP